MVNNVSPSKAYIAATAACIGLSIGAYLIGVWRSGMQLNEQGYYLICLLFGLFSSVTLQKVIRDKSEGIQVSEKYRLITVFAMASSVALFAIGLFNASMLPSEKGFFAMAYILAMYSSITAQKNEADRRACGEPVQASQQAPVSITVED